MSMQHIPSGEEDVGVAVLVYIVVDILTLRGSMICM